MSESSTSRLLARGFVARGYVLGIGLQVVLLLVILGQVVFLASRLRARIDLTGEQIYTLTESTKQVLGGLDDRLQIEAYFSPDAQLSTTLADARRTLRNLLDEYVQNGRGRVVVQYFDPLSDNDLRERATRLGIKPETVGDRADNTLSYKELWQGVRMRYGGRNQKVIPMLQMAAAPFAYEMMLTPAIKALTVEDKPKIGFIAYPSQGARGAQNAFNQLRGAPQINERFALQNISLESGLAIPDEIETLLVIRPKDLSDRHKYVLDQFLMRGGQLVVFADTDDYSVEPEKMFNRRVVSYDAQGSSAPFLDQLASYGVELGTNVLFDLLNDAREHMSHAFTTGQFRMEQPLSYPYWFHPVAVDFAEFAERIATGADGKVDEALASQYREIFLPGVDPEAGKGFANVGMFWPCPVELAEELPAGVEGRVILRTSPFAVAQEPPQTLSPFDRARDPRQQHENYQKFMQQLQGRIQSEPRRQHGLMVSVEGKFSSFFRGKDIPLSPAAAEAKAAREKAALEKEADPLEDEVGADPLGADRDQKDTDEQVGPKPLEDEAKDELADGVVDPDPILESSSPGRLVVIGDSDFIRDDLVTGAYGQSGPVSRMGPLFFVNLLDWLAQDQDLFELRNKIATDRSLKILSDSERQNIDITQVNERLREKQARLRWLNIGLPPLVLLAFGAVVFVRRRTAKRSFLQSLES